MKKSIALATVLSTFLVLPTASATEFKKQGSIPVKDMKESQFHSAAKISMNDAIDVALEHQKGKAVSAELEEENGFLVYEVEVATADNQKSEIYIDAGNKSILGVKMSRS